MKHLMTAFIARTLVLFFLLATHAHAQTPARRTARPAPAAVQTQRLSTAQTLPLRRVILYSNGVAYFERRGIVRGRAEVELAFKQSQVDDVLKSMIVLDLGQGRIGAVSYNSSQPPQARLADIPFTVEAGTQNAADGGLAGVLRQLQGARVAVSAGARVVTGSVLTVESRTAQLEPNKPPVTTHRLVIASADGEIADFDLAEIRSVKLLDDEAQRDIKEFADASASARRRDAKTIVVTSDGDGAREMLVSYTVAAPIWKTTYRVVLDKGGQPFFQGWAIVDNVSEEDWTNVQLSLVSGTPVSFIQPIQQPFYRYRPVVPMPENLNLEPQTHQPNTGEGVGNGVGSISGSVEDLNEAAIAGATVTATNSDTGLAQSTTTDDEGDYTFRQLPAGIYTLTIAAPGFNTTRVTDVVLRSGREVNQQYTLNVASTSESVEVTARDVDELPTNGRGAAGLALMTPGVAAPPPINLSESITSGESGVAAAATGGEVGDLFEYRVDQPVTIRRDRSALIPILQTRMDGERVSIYNEAVRADRPLGGMLLKNTSPLTLEGGSLTVIDADAYAGEALMERVKPNEDRLISFALDLGTLISARTEHNREPVFLLKGGNGVLQAHYYRLEKKTYIVTNQTDKPRVVYIERPLRQGWELRTDEKVEVKRTPTTYRVRVELPARQTVIVPVAERQQLMDTFILTNFTASDLELLVARRYIDEATRLQLNEIVDLKNRIATLDQRAAQLENERAEIAQDQERLRENIKALGNTPDARTLIARYVEKANAQETQLETSTQQRRTLAAERAGLQTQLDRLIREFSVERKL